MGYHALNRIQQELKDIFVFVCASSPETAEELVRCFESDMEVAREIQVFKFPFHGRRHKLEEPIPYIAP